MEKSALKTILSIIGRILQIVLLFVLIIGIVGTVIGSMLGISMVNVAKSAPNIQPENIILSLSENSKILDRDGNLIEAIAFDEYRDIVKYEDIPQNIIDAFISIEDDKFETHKGVSLKSIVRSFAENVSSGGISQGGSTITQQLVKNAYLTNEVTFTRKITEMYLAMKLETELTKDQIMEAYLNRIFFGQHSYGIETASQTYFSKPVKELSTAQAATLAAIAQSPSKFALFEAYPPSSVPEGADVAGEFYVGGLTYSAVKNDAVMSRKDYVLERMLELNKITKEEYDEAIKEDVMAEIVPGSKLGKAVPSQIGSLIREQAIDRLIEAKDLSYDEARNLLYTGGLNIYTTIDWDAQQKLEETYNDFSNIFSDYVYNGVLFGELSYDSYGDIVDDDNLSLIHI